MGASVFAWDNAGREDIGRAVIGGEDGGEDMFSLILT
jgi:hypothetical protein